MNTLNAPPGTTGQIPPDLVTNMETFGKALRALLAPVSPNAVVGNKTISCTNSTAAGVGLELDLGAPVTFNALLTQEDLTSGQLIRS